MIAMSVAKSLSSGMGWEKVCVCGGGVVAKHDQPLLT